MNQSCDDPVPTTTTCIRGPIATSPRPPRFTMGPRDRAAGSGFGGTNPVMSTGLGRYHPHLMGRDSDSRVELERAHIATNQVAHCSVSTSRAVIAALMHRGPRLTSEA